MGFVVLDLATAKTVRSKFHPYMEHNLDLTVQPAARAEHHQPRATATLTAPIRRHSAKTAARAERRNPPSSQKPQFATNRLSATTPSCRTLHPPITNLMDVQKLALAQGMDQTRAALARWNDRPAPVIASWLIGAFAFACGLLIAVLAVASVATPDRTALYMPGLFGSADASDYAHVLVRNLLVLSLHAVACVGGFIACASLPFQAEHMTGFNRWIHERASRVAIAWIALVTCFSLVTQAYILGSTGAQLASQLVISPTTLVATVLPHALIELTAVFLPLAAWTIAARRGSWDELLAATVATVAIAVPMLLLAAAWETWLWPQLLQQASPLSFTFTPG